MKIVLVGGGPANIFLALNLVKDGHIVELYEKTTGIGKKFLVAGKSDLNITHSESKEGMAKKYFENEQFFLELFNCFSNHDLIRWLKSFGIDTFIGSSRRVFPKAIKAKEILNLWHKTLETSENFTLFTKHTLTNIQKDYLEFNHEKKVIFDKVVYALGGASWSRTGSDGLWSELFIKNGIKIEPFKPMNCGFNISWNKEFKDSIDREFIKNITMRYSGKEIRGEIMITKDSIEGTPIYSLSKEIIDSLAKKMVSVSLDLKPDLTIEQLEAKYNSKRKKMSVSNFLKKNLGLNDVSINLLKQFSTKEDYQNNICSLVKDCKIVIDSPRDIEEAISTSGGINLDEIDTNFRLNNLRNHYAIGEMLDWDTITGGYLLQACFSQAYRVYSDLK